MRKARKKLINAEYDERVSHNLEVLAKVLGVQLKEIKRWRLEGFISFPVPEAEFHLLVKMMNVVWGNYSALRCQLAVMTTVKRQGLVRTAELSGFELEVFNLVLRWKLQFPRRYLHFIAARNQLRARFPNGYMQLNSKLLCRAKKAANYVIAKAQKTDSLDRLLNQMDLHLVGGKVRAKKVNFNDSDPSHGNVNYSVCDYPLPDKVIRALPPVGHESSITEIPKKHKQREKGLNPEEIEYLEENFSNSFEKGKKSLQDRLKSILQDSSKKI